MLRRARRGVARLAGEMLAAIVAAGAFAAFMSTASGLLVSIAGTVSYDVWGRRRRTPAERRRRASASPPRSGMVVPGAARARPRARLDISVLVGWAFALAASTFCPLLLLGDLVAAADRRGRRPPA